MAIKYGFFNSVNGDRKYSAEDVGRYLKGIINSGVYPDSTTSLQVVVDEGMAVQVLPGRAMLEYHYLENDSPLVLTLTAGSTQARIDAIVARLDLENRLCEIAIKEGTPAAAPKAPAMSRTDVKSEYMLASVYVAALASTITQDDITDTRNDSTVCGWVRGVIKQETVTIPVPTSGAALYIPTVNKDGDGYELMPTDTTLSFAGAVADAAATGEGINEAKDAAAAAQNAADAHIENTGNPHSVTKAQVGLGNVPNVATDNQTPTFSAASTLTEMTSGEKLSVAFGKIAKAVSSLISHIANRSNPHGVTAKQAGAVDIAGDTMTGQLIIQRDDGMAGITLKDANGKNASMWQVIPTTNQAAIRVYSPGTTYAESYWLTPTEGITAQKSYTILTSKTPVTIAQGGTGAKTAAAARSALGAWPEVLTEGVHYFENESDLPTPTKGRMALVKA